MAVKGGACAFALLAALVACARAPGPPVVPEAGLARPQIGVLREGDGRSALFHALSSRPEGQSYVSGDGFTLTLREGVLLQSRGLGADLMASEPPARALLAAGRGAYMRRWQHAGADDRIVTLTLSCSLAGKAPGRVTESCVGKDTFITNWYEIGAGGAIRESRQWVGPQAGYLRLTTPDG